MERREHKLVAGGKVVEQHPRTRAGRGRHLRQRQLGQAMAEQLVGARLQESGSSFRLRAPSDPHRFSRNFRYG
jgi:hypothetical protein